MAKQIKLEPCPFCGNEVKHVEDGEDGEIECEVCAYSFYDISKNFEWWNYRPIENKLMRRIDHMRDALTALASTIMHINNSLNTILEMDGKGLEWRSRLNLL